MLMGVKDLSSVSKARKMSCKNKDIDTSLTWILEESMAEMRELIKTLCLLLHG